MNAKKTWGRRVMAVLVSVGLASILGCGDQSGLAKRYPVSGKVTYNGAPVEKGKIYFEPTTAQERAASGDITNGSYTLTTSGESNDGALPGKYNVTISSVIIDMSDVLKNAGGGAGHHDDLAKATANAKPVVPSKYQLASTSGLTADVKEQSNSIDFSLKD